MDFVSKDKRVSGSAECDYDWQHADSRNADASVNFNEDATDEEIIALLQDIDFRRRLGKEFGTRSVGFVARTINSERVERGHVADVVIKFLQSNPGERWFEMEGVVE